MKSYEIKHKKCNDLNKSISEKNPETFYVLYSFSFSPLHFHVHLGISGHLRDNAIQRNFQYLVFLI